MGYVEKNLMNNEKVVYKANMHWFIFVPSILIFIIGISFIVISLFFVEVRDQDAKAIFSLGGFAIIFIAFWSFIMAIIQKVSTELAVTTKRVIAKIGFIRRNTIELNHSQVESFHINQSILGRIFDFGTIIINGTGGGKTPIPNIDSPLEFRRNAMEIIDKSQGKS